MVNLLMTSGILTVALLNYSGSVTVLGVIFYLLMLLLGAVLLYSIRMIGIIPVFWTFSSRGTEMLVWQMSRFMERPDRMFRGWVGRILVSILPFSLIASFPARLFLDGFDLFIFFHMISVTVFFFLLMYYLWNLALKNYSSASS
jgi:ABC-2 type transport system permease protein